MNQPTLSLAELNAIAAEFGRRFVLYPEDSVCLNEGSLQTIGPIIADQCESAGSRWCELLRGAIGRGRRFVFATRGFTITE